MQHNVVTGNRTQLGQYHPRSSHHPYAVGNTAYRNNTMVHQNPNMAGMPNSYVVNAPTIFPSTHNLTNYCNTGDTVHILPPLPNWCSIKFRKLPFYKLKHEVIKPCMLNANSHLTLPPTMKTTATQEFHCSFVMSCAMVSDIAMNRDISKSDFLVQAQLRITVVDNTSTAPLNSEYDDFLPLGLVIRVNGRQCSTLPQFMACARQNQETRRIPRPIPITQLLKISPMNVNTLTVNWAPETGKQFIITLNLVEKLSSAFLLHTLKQRPKISVDVTKLTIRQQYRRIDTDENVTGRVDEDDDDIATTIVRVSLVCPLAKFRMMYPAKGKNCSHLQCFDGSAYINLNEKKPMWNCPVCNRSLQYDDLLLDEYFMNVLENEELSSDCQEVQLLVDGTWKSFSEDTSKENEESNSVKRSSNSSPELKSSNSAEDVAIASESVAETNVNADVVDLLSDDDVEAEGSTASTKEPTQQVAAEVPPEVPELTANHNEEMETREENETTVRRTSSVDPTSSREASERANVIALDSPSPPNLEPNNQSSPPHPPMADLSISN